MSIYSGSSPFSRGKLGGNKLAGTKTSRGTAKKRKLRDDARRTVNVVTATGDATDFRGAVYIGGGAATFNDDDSIMKRIANFVSTASLATNLKLFDNTDCFSLKITIGNNFKTDGAFTATSAEEAIGGLKKMQFTLTVEDDTTYEGLFDRYGTGGAGLGGYIIEFPLLTAAPTLGKECTLKITYVD